MPLSASFKSDESFLQKLAIGAAGTRATIERLRGLGFQPIELERGSSGFKIWKRIKIKRVRVPDVLCLRSGLRFESRGKTNLEISMSHSRADPGRAWDAGLAGDDYVVVVLCAQASTSIVDWQPASPLHFVKVEDMQNAFGQHRIKITEPKGVEEGLEIRVIWPSACANNRSIVEQLTPTVRLRPVSGGRSQTVQLNRRQPLQAVCRLGETVETNQIVAAVTPVVLSLAPPADVGEAYFLERLNSLILSERYAAAKALRFRGFERSANALRARMSHEAEDLYVRLEAAAALASWGDPRGWEHLASSLRNPFEQVQLETVIVLSEIRSPHSQALLIGVLTDRNRHEEIRAGAAWALGEFRNEDAGRALVEAFEETSMEVKLEAARALLRIAPDQVPYLVGLMRKAPLERRDGLAWVLARQGQFDPKELLSDRADDNLRRWVAYILGYGKERFHREAILEICQRDPAVYFSASVMWQLLQSWINNLKEY